MDRVDAQITQVEEAASEAMAALQEEIGVLERLKTEMWAEITERCTKQNTLATPLDKSRLVTVLQQIKSKHRMLARAQQEHTRAINARDTLDQERYNTDSVKTMAAITRALGILQQSSAPAKQVKMAERVARDYHAIKDNQTEQKDAVDAMDEAMTSADADADTDVDATPHVLTTSIMDEVEAMFAVENQRTADLMRLPVVPEAALLATAARTRALPAVKLAAKPTLGVPIEIELS